jgi:hypothetical protein
VLLDESSYFIIKLPNNPISFTTASMLSESPVPRAVLVFASIAVFILLLYGASDSPPFLSSSSSSSSGYSFNIFPSLLGGSDFSNPSE